MSSRPPAAVTVRSMAEKTVGAPSFLGPHQFKARARGRVDGEERALRLAFRRLQRRPLAHLREVHIMEKRPDHGEIGVFEVAEPVERRHLEGFFQGALAPLFREVCARKGGQRRARGFARRFGGLVRRLIVREKKLRGAQAQKLACKIGRRHLAEKELAGRDVERGDVVARRRALAISRERSKKVVADGNEKRVLGKRSRCHEPHHIAAHDGFRPALFGKLRVLKLFGHRDAKALADELLKIVVGARDGHAAHGDVFAGMLAALRKLDAERIRGRDRVVEEQLEEIAHAVEEQKFRVLGLHLKVLRHHGRGAFRLTRIFSRLALLPDRRHFTPP